MNSCYYSKLGCKTLFHGTSNKRVSCLCFVMSKFLFYIFIQTQEEVCDLKQAGPFQKIIPKPYVSMKGKGNCCKLF